MGVNVARQIVGARGVAVVAPHVVLLGLRSQSRRQGVGRPDGAGPLAPESFTNGSPARRRLAEAIPARGTLACPASDTPAEETHVLLARRAGR